MKNIVILIVAALLFCVPALAQQTEVNNSAAARMLLGKHMLSLQWVSWEARLERRHLACMSAKHEQTVAVPCVEWLYAAELRGVAGKDACAPVAPPDKSARGSG